MLEAARKKARNEIERRTQQALRVNRNNFQRKLDREYIRQNKSALTPQIIKEETRKRSVRTKTDIGIQKSN